MIKLNSKFVLTKQINDAKIKTLYQTRVNAILKTIKTKKALGLNFTGWIDYPNKVTKTQLQKIVSATNKIKNKKIKYLVVIGIGGSYLGLKACLDMTNAYKNSNLSVIFIHNIHQNYLLEMLRKVKNDKYGIVVISKSGRTLEPALAFDMFYQNLVQKFGKKTADELIIAVTSQHAGDLRETAIKNKWQTFFIPDNIGGRYSALTPVGLITMAFCGLDLNKLFSGAKDATKKLKNASLLQNDAYRYACYRHYFFKTKKMDIENIVVYDPYLQSITKTMQQLFAESEGKQGQGLYPASCLFTTDLHSLGQYLQQGKKCFFETSLFVKKTHADCQLKIKDPVIKYLNKFKLSKVNEIAFLSTIKAHAYDGKINNLIIEIDKQDAYHFGYLYTWLMYTAMMSAYLLKVNPFDQPGVEAYKKRMNDVLKNKNRK